MKKLILAFALLGVVVVSCGKKETNKAEEKVEETTVETTENNQKIDLTHKIVWEAFKTPEKVGVKGSFNQVNLTVLNKEESDLTASLKDAKFEVVVSSVNTDDEGRDEKLRDYFFNKLNGNITGSFGEFKDGKVVVTLTMNGITKEKEFTYEAGGNSIDIKGDIDIIADFSANTALQSLHEICKDLHEGKTWSEVKLEVKIEK